MRLRHTIVLHAIVALGIGLNGFCHETDDDISFVKIEFPGNGVWKASARLDGEAIFLSLAEGWPNEAEYSRLKDLYWDFSKTGSELRLIFLEAIAGHIVFKAGSRELPYEYNCSIDPEFDYEASLGQSFWGLVEYTGTLPENAESFVTEIPPSYFPLQYEIQLPGRDDSLKEFFRPRKGRAPRPFRFMDESFEPVETDTPIDIPAIVLANPAYQSTLAVDPEVSSGPEGESAWGNAYPESSARVRNSSLPKLCPSSAKKPRPFFDSI